MKIYFDLRVLALISSMFFGFKIQDSKPYSISEYVIERQAYSLSYDGQHKQAKWVYEYLTERNLEKNADRGGMGFKSDPDLPKKIQATKADYQKSGFDRGHLCPAADASFDERALQETFYLSNISPQFPQFNRAYWGKLERYVRTLLLEYKVLHVYAGPLYLPYEENGRKYVKYEVIGENHVAVPTHFFKVIFLDADKGLKPLVAFILPNKAIGEGSPLDEFLTTVEKVEKAAGFIFPR